MIADRFLLQQSWWLASELGRRHPELWVDRFWADGSGPVLVVGEPGTDVRVYFDLRHGIRVDVGNHKSHLAWEAHLERPDAHDSLKLIERTAGLPVKGKAPATTARSIVYRLIARMLAMHVDTARPWVPVPVDVNAMVRGDLEPSDDPLITDFLSVHNDLLAHRKSALARYAPAEIGMSSYLWAMTRDVETAFVLDTDGWVHTRAAGARELLPVYDDLGRDIDRLAVAVLEVGGVTRR